MTTDPKNPLDMTNMKNIETEEFIEKVLKETGLKLVELREGTTTRDHILLICGFRKAYYIIKDLESVCGDENHKWDGSLNCPCMICDCARRTALLFPDSDK